MSRLPGPLVGLLVFFALGAAVPAAGYEGYHRLSEVEAALREWAGRHPDRMTLVDAGTSAGGHKLWVARLGAGAGAGERAAVFVGANVAGYHHAGTEAALDLVRTLLEDDAAAKLLGSVTFYVAPVLNPDAHDAFFAGVRARRSGNGMSLDRDRDGFTAEDGYDDLDGDGRVTELRIPDLAGEWLPHPEEPRLMVRRDSTAPSGGIGGESSAKGWAGAYRLESEGRDDDGDGRYNEDPEAGIAVDSNFPHAFAFPDEPAAGPWPGYAPEARALLDFFFARPQVAAAVIYGPANNLLELPQSLGGGGDPGTQKFKVPPEAAEFLGFDPEQEYTLDEVWEAAKDLPFVRRQNLTKEQLAQFLGAGPATRLEDDDQKLLERLAKAYEKRLEDARLDAERPVKQYARGGLTPWLYYQRGVLALELDVWGIPKPEKERKEGDEEKKLTVDGLADMSAEDFLAFSEEEVAAFLKEAGVPPRFSAAMAIERVKAGQLTPAQMAQMIQTGGGGGGDDPEKDDPRTQRRRDVLAWIDAHHPQAYAPWTAVTLAGGLRAEAGGLDPFAELAPPSAADLAAAIRVHTGTVLDLAGRLARVEIASLEAEDLGAGVYRIRAVAVNRGELPTHTKMAVRSRAHLPVRLELAAGAELVTGQRAVTAERLERAGALRGEWLVQVRPAATVTVRVVTETAGSDEKTLTLSRGGSR